MGCWKLQRRYILIKPFCCSMQSESYSNHQLKKILHNFYSGKTSAPVELETREKTILLFDDVPNQF